MTVYMTHDYVRYGNSVTTLEWTDSDMVSFTREGDTWKLVFGEANLTTNAIPAGVVAENYISKSEVEVNYISKDDLKELLAQRRGVYKRQAVEQAGRGFYESARTADLRAAECNRIISDVDLAEIHIP